MKYAEITIIKKQRKPSFFDYFIHIFPQNDIITNEDLIIVLFGDDNSVYEVKSIINNKKYKFAIKGYNHNYPIYFSKDKDTFFFEELHKNSENIKQISHMFKENPNIINYKMDASIHNMIYYNLKYNQETNKNRTDVFSIVKIKSNKDKPRYVLAYDEMYFDNNDVLYLVDGIFRDKFMCLETKI